MINNLYSESFALKIKFLVNNIRNKIAEYLKSNDIYLLSIIKSFNKVYASYYKYLLSSECGIDKTSQENNTKRYLQDNTIVSNENNIDSFYIPEDARNMRLVREDYANILPDYLKANKVDFLKLSERESSLLIENEVFSVYYILNNEQDYKAAKLDNLPYVEYSECEIQLKKNNVINEKDFLVTLIV